MIKIMRKQLLCTLPAASVVLFLLSNTSHAVQGVNTELQNSLQNEVQEMSKYGPVPSAKKLFDYNPVGKPAPPFDNVQTAEGLTISLSDFAGKTVVLEWHSPDCPYVQKHYDSNNMQKLQDFARTEKIVWITINSSALGKKGFLESRKAWEYIARTNSRANHYVIDSKGGIGMAYNAISTPSIVIIDSGGNIAYYGAIDDRATTNQKDVPIARNYVQQAFNNLLLGMPANPSATMPYGCPVKYELVPDN
jgi:hypothetical protein